MIGGRANERVCVRIATHHSLQHNDVRGRDGVGLAHEIAETPFHLVAEPSLADQLGSHVFVLRRELDIQRASRSVSQQLELYRANATADLEHAVSR